MEEDLDGEPIGTMSKQGGVPMLVGGFSTFFIFPYIGNNHPN